VNKYRVNEEQLLYRFTPYIEVHYMPLWFLGQKIKREKYMLLVYVSVYIRRGWDGDWGNTLKRKKKK